MEEALGVLGIGLGVVFFGLICLIGIIYLMSFIVGLFRRDELSPRRKHEDVSPVTEHFTPAVHPALSGEKRRETVAAISAAVAEFLGSDVEGIRIHSIKRVGDPYELTPSDRRELIAVISASIAESMGTDVTGIRIRSIRRV